MAMREALRAVATFIRNLAAAGNNLSEPSHDVAHLMFSVTGYGSVMLWGDEVAVYRKCIEALHATSEKTGHISKRAIEQHFQRAVLVALDLNESQPGISLDDRIAVSLENLKVTLQAAPQEHTIFKSVAGVSHIGLPLQIGNVTFQIVDEHEMESWFAVVGDVIARNKRIPPDQKSGHLDSIKKELMSHFRGKTVARLQVRAVDQIAADLLALRELRLTIDVVNFYADMLYGPSERVRVYLPNEGQRLWEGTFHLLGNQEGYHLNTGLRGPRSDFELGKLTAPNNPAPGFREISELLALGKRSKLQDRILSSFHWAGRATIAARSEEAFLLYAISLESLLLGNRNETDIGYRLRMRGAQLLGNGLDRRKAIVEDLRKLYRIRSQIVHSGSVQVADADLSLIRMATKSALLIVLTESDFQAMNSEEEFDSWFDDRLLSSPDDGASNETHPAGSPN